MPITWTPEMAAKGMLSQDYDRINVWEQTKAFYSSEPEYPSTVLKEIPSDFPSPSQRRHSSTKVEFYEEDCVDIAVLQKQYGMNPILHNMCDWDVAGGSVDTGSSAQEEELFRRSNYYKHLHQNFYPLEKYHTIISNGVEFIRRGYKDGYTRMDKAETLDCVAAPALVFPEILTFWKDTPSGPVKVKENEFAKKEDIECMRRKLYTLLYAAYSNGNDCLVTSAWGCGAYGGPTHHIGKLFREVLEDCKGVLPHIIFAILGRNMEPFQKGFYEAGPWVNDV